MSDQSSQPHPEPPPRSESGPRLESGGDLSVGGDVAGRDVVKHQTTVNQTVTGFSEKTVVRLMVVVGVLVFVTAACFFSGGLVVGAAALTALDKQVGSSPEEAVLFQQKLQFLSAAAPGQSLNFSFTEDEISSYVKFILGPELGFLPETGKVRLVNDQQVIVAGRLADLGGLEVAATFELSNQPGQPLALQSAAAHVLPVSGSTFGWTAIPTGLLQPAADQLNARLGNVQLVNAFAVQDQAGAVSWELDLVTR
ncbi:MAG: hypothetical protein JNK29_15685 [Anaerolineales bacterium]|nr:hypothetical protein [Anaerolineales bacterium]